MMSQKNTVSHADIAALLKVTQSTVSRALDPARSHLISEATRRRVEEAAASLGFQPNIHARRTRTRCSEALTVVIDNLIPPPQHYFNDFSQMNQQLTFDFLTGIVDGATEDGFEVKLLPLHSRKEISADFLQRSLRFPYSDGIIFIGYHFMRDFYSLISGNSSVPHLIVSGSAVQDAPMPAFAPDPEPGIRAAAAELIRRGHRCFLYQAFDLNRIPAYQYERYAVWERVLKELAPQSILRTIDIPDAKELRRAARSFAESPQDFTAILTANDGAADIWRRELDYYGAKVPGDFAVVGFDGNESFSGLSSVVVPYYGIGRAAAHAVITAVKNGKTVDGERFATTFRLGNTI